MKAIMNFKELKNTQELQTFLEGTQAINLYLTSVIGLYVTEHASKCKKS